MLKSLPSSFWISTAGFKFGIFHGEFRMSGRFAWSGLWRICSCYPWNMFEVSPKMYHYYRQHIYCAKKRTKLPYYWCAWKLLPSIKPHDIKVMNNWDNCLDFWYFMWMYYSTTWNKNELKYMPKKIGFGSTYCSKETLKNLHILCSIRKPM